MYIFSLLPIDRNHENSVLILASCFLGLYDNACMKRNVVDELDDMIIHPDFLAFARTAQVNYLCSP